VSQVLEILVRRGYVERRGDPDDRRRNILELTPVGREVLDAVVGGVEAVDDELLQRVSPEHVSALRETLAALAEIKAEGLESGKGLRRPQRLLTKSCPIFAVRDVAATLAHYASLGFETASYEGGDNYGFANRDGVGIHFQAHPEEDHHHQAATYLYVRDADALYEEWSRPGIGGETHPVEDTQWEMREGAHVDPDGNRIRFGSPIED
jgi:catechol 2,3-dioxygenase-like lactoylglutathione lyase family enzyme